MYFAIITYWFGLHVHSVLLCFAFHPDVQRTTARIVCNLCGDDVISASTAQKWFLKFKSENFGFGDTGNSRKPSEFNKDPLKGALKKDGRQTGGELIEKMYCDHVIVLNHLQSISSTQRKKKTEKAGSTSCLPTFMILIMIKMKFDLNLDFCKKTDINH